MSGVRRAATPAPTRGTATIAAEVKALLAGGADEEARERYAELVAAVQRRASGVALYYLRDRAEADEAVQDAFVKAFFNLRTFDESLSFDVWFGRILVNGCLDRLKARGRRSRWFVAPASTGAHDAPAPAEAVSPGPTPEDAVLGAEATRALRRAIDGLPARQRTVVVLTQLDGRSAAEVGAITGLSESTVRVHLFRAIRRLRHLLGVTVPGRSGE